MGQAKDFLDNNKIYIMLGIITFLVIVIFVGGVMLGKGIKSQQELKASEKALKEEIRQADIIIKSSTKNAQLLVDSAEIYKEYAKRQGLVTEKIHTQINKVKNETQKNINNIDLLSRDSNVVLFSRYAQEYIDSTN